MLEYLFWTSLVVTVIGVGVWIIMRIRSGVGVTDGERSGLRTSVGPARILAAMAVLQRLTRSGDGAVIAAGVDEIELPLLQSIPDCPPALKPGLAQALEDAATACPNREAAKRLMTLRNAVVGKSGQPPAARATPTAG